MKLSFMYGNFFIERAAFRATSMSEVSQIKQLEIINMPKKDILGCRIQVSFNHVLG
jgi:hypothetical protein